MFAIIELGGNQHKIEEGETLTVDRIPGDPGETVTFDKVLLISDGKTVKVGTPYLKGVSVSADVTEQGRGRKKIVFRYHSKTRYRKTKGHRQPQTRVRVAKISSRS